MAYLLLTESLIFFLLCLIGLWMKKICWSNTELTRLASAIPGPKGWPVIGNSLDFLEISTQKLFQKILQYFSTNPEIFKFWIGPKLIVGLSKPENLEIILNHRQCLAKDPLVNVMKPLTGNGLFSAPVVMWKKNRKLINAFFRQNILESFIPAIDDASNNLLCILARNAWSNELNIFEMFNNCVISFMSGIAMGVKRNDQAEAQRFGLWLEELLPILLIRMTNVFYRMDNIFRWTNYKKIQDELLSNINKYIMNKIVERKAQLMSDGQLSDEYHLNEESVGMLKIECFLDMLLFLSDNNKQFNFHQMRDEVTTFLVGSTETTATAMSFCCLLLGMHPMIQQQVYEEIMKTVGEDGKVTSQVLPDLKYLECCILETMRIFPLAPLLLRITTADIKLENLTIPENSTLLIGVMPLHRNPKYWKNPLKFDPSRFTSEEIAKRHRYSFLPFSAGPRACIGLKFAMIIMKIFMANVLRKFEVKTEYTSIEEIELKMNIVLRPVNGYKVSVVPRN